MAGPQLASWSADRDLADLGAQAEPDNKRRRVAAPAKTPSRTEETK
jgi:hypothetical protein